MSARIHHPAIGVTERPNFSVVTLGGITIWFSYETPIAFQGALHRSDIIRYRKTVRENEWGPTTGKHLNFVDHGDKYNRVTGEEFMRRLEHAITVKPQVMDPADVLTIMEMKNGQV